MMNEKSIWQNLRTVRRKSSPFGFFKNAEDSSLLHQKTKTRRTDLVPPRAPPDVYT